MATRSPNYPRPALQNLPRPSLVPMAPKAIYWPYQEERADTDGTKHFHWGVQAFTEMQDGGNMTDVVMLEVEAPNEELAITRAMSVLQRPYYRVNWVREACSIDPTLKKE